MKKIITLLISVAFVIGCGSTQRTDYVTYLSSDTLPGTHALTVSLPMDKNIDLRGIYNGNNTIQQNAVFYAADAGLVGLFAQIITHAAINANLQDLKLAKQQQQANGILLPLESIMRQLKQASLIHESIRYQFQLNDQLENNAPLMSYPIFYMSQDKKTISIKHLVKVHNKNQKKLIYENLIEIITSPIISDDPIGSFSHDNGKLLKEILLGLYKDSLDLAVSDYSGELVSSKNNQKTHKFYHGINKRVERGTTIESRCNSHIIRNLRGWIISYPDKKNSDCTA